MSEKSVAIRQSVIFMNSDAQQLTVVFEKLKILDFGRCDIPDAISGDLHLMAKIDEAIGTSMSSAVRRKASQLEGSIEDARNALAGVEWCVECEVLEIRMKMYESFLAAIYHYLELRGALMDIHEDVRAKFIADYSSDKLKAVDLDKIPNGIKAISMMTFGGQVNLKVGPVRAPK